MDGASIYILMCVDGSDYTGITKRSVDERVSEHAQGLDPACYTFRRRPLRLVHSERYARIVDAIAAGRRIKGWTRTKKEAYIRGDFDLLSDLARRRSGKPRPEEPASAGVSKDDPLAGVGAHASIGRRT